MVAGGLGWLSGGNGWFRVVMSCYEWLLVVLVGYEYLWGGNVWLRDVIGW